MPKIVCPRCGASVKAEPAAGGAALSEPANAAACLELGALGALDGCRSMQAAVAVALEALAEPAFAALRPDGPGDDRLFRRWQPLAGTLAAGAGEHGCTVLDISPAGAALWCAAAAEVPEGAAVRFRPDGHDEVPAEVLRREGEVLRLAFLLDAEGKRAVARWIAGLRKALQRRR
jgi:hypothetical protein